MASLRAIEAAMRADSPDLAITQLSPANDNVSPSKDTNSGESDHVLYSDDDPESHALTPPTARMSTPTIPSPFSSTTIPLRGGGQVSEQAVTNNITRKFAQFTREIAHGRLVSTEDFNLFDAVSAVEIGDPKMDSGLLGAKLDEPVFDPYQPLSVDQLIWVMDQHLFHFLNFMDGFPLPQTLYTSQYVDMILQSGNAYRYQDFHFPQWAPPPDSHSSDGDVDVDLVHDAQMFTMEILKFTVVAICKMVGIVLARIDESRAPIYEQEDISFEILGRDFFPHLEVLEIFHQALFLANLTEERKTRLTVSRELTASDRRVTGMFDQLESQIGTLGHLLGCIELHRRPHDGPRGSYSFESLAKMFTWTAFYYAKGLGPVEGVFTTALQRKMASTAPIRPIVSRLAGEYDESINRLLSDLEIEQEDVFSMNSLFGYPGTDWTRCLRTYNLTERMPFCRATLFTWLWNQPDQTFINLIATDIVTLLPYKAFKNDVKLENGSLFLQPVEGNGEGCLIWEFAKMTVKFENSMIDVLRGLTSNASRMRRTLLRCIPTLQHLRANEATELDDELQLYSRNVPVPEPFDLWIDWQIVKCAEIYVQEGFTQDIYGAWESAFMYLFLQKAMDDLNYGNYMQKYKNHVWDDPEDCELVHERMMQHLESTRLDYSLITGLFYLHSFLFTCLNSTIPSWVREDMHGYYRTRFKGIEKAVNLLTLPNETPAQYYFREADLFRVDQIAIPVEDFKGRRDALLSGLRDASHHFSQAISHYTRVKEHMNENTNIYFRKCWQFDIHLDRRSAFAKAAYKATKNWEKYTANKGPLVLSKWEYEDLKKNQTDYFVYFALPGNPDNVLETKLGKNKRRKDGGVNSTNMDKRLDDTVRFLKETCEPSSSEGRK